MSTPVAIGVDNGGTWIRIKGLDVRGRCVWSLQKPSPPVDQLPEFIKKHLSGFGPLRALAVGSRGVWKRSKRRTVKQALHGVAKTVVVMSDVEAAWLAAFGNAGSGIIVIAGTGSIAYGKKTDGTFARAGGLGPDKGDEGSGYWIGRQWLLRTSSYRRKDVRQIASLAPRVIQQAKRKNPIAMAIIQEAQSELANLVEDVRKQLRFKKTPVSWSGSILDNPWFRKGFFKALKPYPVIKKARKMDAATALAKSIMSHASR